MGNKNTNEDSLGQKFLRTHTPPDRAQQKRMGKAGVAADRKQRARMKMIDMSPAQKQAEKKRLLKKRTLRDASS